MAVLMMASSLQQINGIMLHGRSGPLKAQEQEVFRTFTQIIEENLANGNATLPPLA